MHRSFVFLAAIMTIACGGGDAAQSETHAEPITAQTTGDETMQSTNNRPTVDVFVIAPLTLTIDGRRFALSADGQLTLEGAPQESLPQLRSNGEIAVDGEVLATVSADGTYRNQRGDVIGVITEDGTTTIGDVTLTFGNDGTLEGGGDGPPAVLTPADSLAKRAAMAVIVLLMI